MTPSEKQRISQEIKRSGSHTKALIVALIKQEVNEIKNTLPTGGLSERRLVELSAQARVLEDLLAQMIAPD